MEYRLNRWTRIRRRRINGFPDQAERDELKRRAAMVRQHASVFELSQDAIVVRDAHNQITFWNRGASETFGWSAPEAEGQLLNVLLQTEPAAWEELNRRLDQLGTWEGELRQTRRDGSLLIVHTREVVMRGDDGHRSMVLSIQRDVTERRKAEESLRETDRRKDEFLAMVAHELRNPLAAIVSAVDVLQRAAENPELLASTCDVLQRQVRQMSCIVEDLIDSRRTMERKLHLRKERIALQTILETALESCRKRVEIAGLKLSVDLPVTPIYLHADPVRLAQVFINLLNNATKFTNPGGSVWISTELSGTDGSEDGTPVALREVTVRVRDNGIGIPGDLLPHIFEVFMQGTQSIESRASGLGMGLTLVRSLVLMHGGDVKAHSDGPGCGSEFYVHLPTVDAASIVSSDKAPSAEPRPEVRAARHRVLVVDDNRDQANSLGMLLELIGHEVHVARDGPSAIELAELVKPGVALIDIDMPGMSGYQVAAHLRAKTDLGQLTLLAHTGWGRDEDRLRSQQAGFDFHLIKPVTSATLQEVLSKCPVRS